MLTPLIHAPTEVQIHVAAAILCMVLAPVQFLRRRRDRTHKVIGYTWVTAMAVTAVSSFWIRGFHVFGEFSPIHALSVIVLIGLGQAIHAVRRGKVDLHRVILQRIAVWSLGVAGLFTLIPGRLMSEILFPAAPLTGFVSVLVPAVVLMVLNEVRIARASRTGSARLVR